MTRTDFLKTVATNTGYSLRVIREVSDAMQDVLFQNVENDFVKIFEGVTLGSIPTLSRFVRNPQTGEMKEVPAMRRAKCKFGKPYKDAINGKR